MPKACKLFSINSSSPILEHFSFSDLTPWWVTQVFNITDGQKLSSFQFCIVHDDLDSYKPVPAYPLTPVILLVWQLSFLKCSPTEITCLHSCDFARLNKKSSLILSLLDSLSISLTILGVLPYPCTCSHTYFFNITNQNCTKCWK